MGVVVEEPSPLKVLLVEDEPNHAELMLRAFADASPDYEVTWSRSIQEAIGALEGEGTDPDIIVTDYRLPDGKGTSLLETWRDAPLVVITSQGDETIAVDAIKAGAVDYVVKSEPMLFELPRVVERSLREWRLRATAERAERERRVADERLQLALMGSAVTAVSQDRELRIEWVYNQRLDRTSADILGKTDHDLLGRESADRLTAVKRRAIETGAPMREEVPVEMNDRRYDFDLMVYPHKDAAGQVTSITSIANDVTEQRQMQRALAERERLAAVGTAAAMLAHEIANPLNGMYVSAQLVERKAVRLGADELVAGIRTCQREILRLNELLREFRQWSRRPTLHADSVAPRELVLEVLDDLRAADVPEGVQVVQDLPVASTPVVLDRSKVKQVLLNLAKNAVEAMAEGGTLTLRTRVTEQRVVFEVHDTGCGIDQDVDPFEAFQTTKADGTGLGLAISRQIILALGGDIRYASEAGRGTTFTVVVPCSAG